MGVNNYCWQNSLFLACFNVGNADESLTSAYLLVYNVASFPDASFIIQTACIHSIVTLLTSTNPVLCPLEGDIWKDVAMHLLSIG